MTRPHDPFTPDTDLERALRAALSQEADQIMPADRSDAIRAQTLGRHRGLPPWLLPLAASLLVLVVGVGIWGVTRPQPTPVPATPTGTSAPVTTPSASPTGTAAPSPTGSANVPTTGPAVTTAPPAGLPYSAPVYYVGPGTSTQPWLLTRDFVPATTTADQPAARAVAALQVLLDGALPDGTRLPYAGLLTPWQPGTTARVSTDAAGEIVVVLSRPGRADLSGEQQRAAMQSLVWTVTAALQDDKPVRISVDSGGAVFPTMPAGVYQRPAETWRDLAPIWITDPSRWKALGAGPAVVAKGQATVFEASVSWELRRADGSKVKDGFTTASAGAPERGDWQVDLGPLPAGSYLLRAFEVSANDGSVAFETSVPFTVQ